ncbi:MAG: hypothetical protein CK425_03095 [Parachlamydia sp.]|nr:MAG: hypothetical protein CK425_03095 [Parachlamydia sp.]
MELDFIHWVHQFRNPGLDQFFRFLNFFDRQEFFFILIPIIWLGQGWKTGLRLFYILLLSGLINHLLKDIFATPRPFNLTPHLGLIKVSGFGFPSGAAQTVILLGGLLCTFWQSPWKWLVASIYIGLVSFSRIYLGVHFPSDILGGWLVGLGLWAIYVYVFPVIERQFDKLSPGFLFVLSQAIPLLLLRAHYSQVTMRLASVAMGLGIGIMIMHSCHLFLPPPKDTKEYVLRGIIGVSGTFACYGFTWLLPSTGNILYLFPRFLLLGLWLALGSVLICRKFFSESNSSKEIN